MTSVSGISALLVIAFIQPPLYAQDAVSDTSRPGRDTFLRRNAASILFERNLNTFNWIGQLIVDTTSANTHVRLDELYTSNIILIEGGGSTQEQRLQSNKQQLLLRLNHPLSETFSAKGEWSSLIYSDNKAVGLSTASVNSVLGGFEYTPDRFISLQPMIGHRWDNQIDVRDRGLSYRIGARTNEIDLDGYRIGGSGLYQRDHIDPRLLEQHFVRMRAQKAFLGSTRDTMEISVSRNRREFYAVSTTAVESRVENIFSFVNLLDYEFAPTFITSVFVNVYSRGLEKDYRPVTHGVISPGFNTGIDEFRLDAFVEARYQDYGGITISSRFGITERNEKHFVTGRSNDFVPDTISNITERSAQLSEQTKDNFTRRTSLSGEIKIPVWRTDSISLSGAASILRYDTPSDQNVEDRDELLVALSLSTFHRINRYLDVTLSLDGTLNHIVYLLKDRSANNNINRVLRFSPRTVYKPFAELTSMNAFEVLANYTVYDFEQEAAQVRSFSYRQFGWIDSTSLEITNRIGLDFFVYLKLYDRGQLNWHEFTERRENSFVDKTYALQVRFSPDEGTLLAVGIRYFSQSRYTYIANDRRLDSFLRSFGPTCLLMWRLSPRSELGLKGWYEQRRLEGGGTRALANMTLNINITL